MKEKKNLFKENQELVIALAAASVGVTLGRVLVDRWKRKKELAEQRKVMDMCRKTTRKYITLSKRDKQEVNNESEH